MTLIMGCTSFVRAAGDKSNEGRLTAMLLHSRERQDLRLVTQRKDHLRQLRGLIHSSISPGDLRSTYAAIIYELNLSFGVFYETLGPCDLVDIFIWVANAQNLIPLLERQEPEALAILAHFCLLLNRLPEHWWLEGWVGHLMAMINSTLDDSYRSWIAWPLKEIRWSEDRETV